MCCIVVEINHDRGYDFRVSPMGSLLCPQTVVDSYHPEFVASANEPFGVLRPDHVVFGASLSALCSE